MVSDDAHLDENGAPIRNHENMQSDHNRKERPPTPIGRSKPKRCLVGKTLYPVPVDFGLDDDEPDSGSYNAGCSDEMAEMVKQKRDKGEKRNSVKKKGKGAKGVKSGGRCGMKDHEVGSKMKEMPDTVASKNSEGIEAQSTSQAFYDYVMSLRFNSVEEAEEFYLDYATKMGFKMRRGSKLGKDFTTARLWVCSAHGTRDAKKSPHKRKPRPQTRFSCGACFRVKYDNPVSDYMVSKFVQNHTHDLQKRIQVPGPPKVQYDSSNPQMSRKNKSKEQQCDSSDPQPSKKRKSKEKQCDSSNPPTSKKGKKKKYHAGTYVMGENIELLLINLQQSIKDLIQSHEKKEMKLVAKMEAQEKEYAKKLKNLEIKVAQHQEKMVEEMNKMRDTIDALKANQTAHL